MQLDSPQPVNHNDVSSRPAVVCLEPDLFFAARLDDVIRACGGQPVVVETPDEFVAAVDRYFPVLALLDLNAPGEWGDGDPALQAATTHGADPDHCLWQPCRGRDA